MILVLASPDDSRARKEIVIPAEMDLTVIK